MAQNHPSQRKETAMYYSTFDTRLCPITLIGDEEGLQRLYMHTGDEKYPLVLEDDWQENPGFFQPIIQQLQAYSQGLITEFQVKLNPSGTVFQKKAWEALRQIPYGEWRSYKDQAILCGNPKASRAVGSANGKNPIPIIIPCHRVIGSKGQLSGFAFGLDIKKRLLELEASRL